MQIKHYLGLATMFVVANIPLQGQSIAKEIAVDRIRQYLLRENNSNIQNIRQAFSNAFSEARHGTISAQDLESFGCTVLGDLEGGTITHSICRTFGERSIIYLRFTYQLLGENFHFECQFWSNMTDLSLSRIVLRDLDNLDRPGIVWAHEL